MANEDTVDDELEAGPSTQLTRQKQEQLVSDMKEMDEAIRASEKELSKVVADRQILQDHLDANDAILASTLKEKEKWRKRWPS